MIIPQEDSEFIETQKPSVMKLWLRCWRCDPYGSGWQDLSHDLSPSAFKKAKRILSDKGLFVFEPKKSSRDGRETTHWRILNLHGARKNDFWLKLEDSFKSCEAPNEPSKAPNKPSKAPNKPSISDQSHTESQSQNPSESSQERLSNSSKELLETLATEKEVSDQLRCQASPDRDRDIALKEQVTSASLPNENQVQSLHSFHCVTVVPDCLSNEEEKDSLGAACPQTPRGQKGKEITTPTEEILNQEYIPNPQSEEAVVRAVAQNLAIEEQKTTKEYQTTSKEAFARIRAIFDEKKKQKQTKRESNLRGDSPMSLSERQAFEEYKREVETNRKKQTEEELVDFWDF